MFVLYLNYISTRLRLGLGLDTLPDLPSSLFSSSLKLGLGQLRLRHRFLAYTLLFGCIYLYQM